MASQTILATLPGAGPHQRLQVILSQQADDALLIELCEQHHGEGIGWFDQRRLRLDPRQWRQLQAVLGRGEAAEQIETAADAPRATLPFPGPAPRPSRRTAAGDRA